MLSNLRLLLKFIEESEQLLIAKQAKVGKIENELKDKHSQLKKAQSDCKNLKEDIVSK